MLRILPLSLVLAISAMHLAIDGSHTNMTISPSVTSWTHQIMSESTEDHTATASLNSVSTSVAASGEGDLEPKKSIIYDGTVSKEKYDVISLVTTRFLIPIVCIIGIVSNIISIFVFYHPHTKLQPCSKVYLKALCISDVTYLTLALYGEVVEYFIPLNPELVSKIVAYGFPYYEITVMRGAVGMSTFLVVIISIERFIAVCFPFWVNKSVFCTRPSIPIYISLLIHVTIAALLAPCFDIVPYHDPLYDVTMWRNRYSAFATRGNFLQIFSVVMEILYRGVSVCVVVLCSICTVVCIQIAAKRRQAMTHSGTSKSSGTTTSAVSSEAQITRMLLGLALLFLICMLPSLFTGLLHTLNADWSIMGREHFMFLTVAKMSVLTSRINSAANIFVYVLSSRNFRTVLWTIFCIDKTGERVGKTAKRVTKSTNI